MIDESIKIRFNNVVGSDLSLNPLLDFMQSSGIKFKDRTLRGPLAFATFYGVYLNLNSLLKFNTRYIYFVVLHEICHSKRINRLGRETMLEYLSIKNYEKFCDFVIGEEILADRYACYVYYKLTNEIFPRGVTQQLHIKNNRDKYEKSVSKLFGVIDNDENNYKKLLKSFIE